MALEDPFIGRGWAFPPAFDAASGSAVLAEGRAEIEQSLAILFSTRLGERIMRPDYGCGMDGEVFEAMGSARLAWIEEAVRMAILYHEPRIDADEVSVTADAPEGRLLIAVGYRVRGTNSRFNMVWPYYQSGGADGG